MKQKEMQLKQEGAGRTLAKHQNKGTKKTPGSHNQPQPIPPYHKTKKRRK